MKPMRKFTSKERMSKASNEGSYSCLVEMHQETTFTEADDLYDLGINRDWQTFPGKGRQYVF